MMLFGNALVTGFLRNKKLLRTVSFAGLGTEALGEAHLDRGRGWSGMEVHVLRDKGYRYNRQCVQEAWQILRVTFAEVRLLLDEAASHSDTLAKHVLYLL